MRVTALRLEWTFAGPVLVEGGTGSNVYRLADGSMHVVRHEDRHHTAILRTACGFERMVRMQLSAREILMPLASGAKRTFEFRGHCNPDGFRVFEERTWPIGIVATERDPMRRATIFHLSDGTARSITDNIIDDAVSVADLLKRLGG